MDHPVERVPVSIECDARGEMAIVERTRPGFWAEIHPHWLDVMRNYYEDKGQTE
jgi:hypothetical protein